MCVGGLHLINEPMTYRRQWEYAVAPTRPITANDYAPLGPRRPTSATDSAYFVNVEVEFTVQNLLNKTVKVIE